MTTTRTRNEPVNPWPRDMNAIRSSTFFNFCLYFHGAFQTDDLQFKVYKSIMFIEFHFRFVNAARSVRCIGVVYGRVTSLYTEHNNNPYESRVCYVTYSFFFRPFIVIYYVVTSFNVNTVRLPRCFASLSFYSVAKSNEFPINVI